MFANSLVSQASLLVDPLQSPNRGAVAPVSPGLIARNSIFDALFYDVGALTAAELATLSPLVDREGTLVVVPPAKSGRAIRHYVGADEMLAAEGKDLRAIAIAGVGSSVFGTAALARNVADAYGVDVAGIVSGYGAADLITEALGGWFFFGALDHLRHSARRLVERGVPEHVLFGAPRRVDGARRRALDSKTLADVIERAPALSLAIGHSKGCLLLDFVLERLAREHKSHRAFDTLRIATFGAVVDFSPRFTRQHQFIGSLDWFGGMNSRLHVPFERVPNAWHHLNRALPFHVPATRVLAEKVPLD